MRVAVDFSALTTLFPGVRLCDDTGGYYAESLAALRDVLGKMPLLGSADALLTLHDASELPPANFSGDPQGATRASIAATLQALAAEAAALNVSLHLRRAARNDAMAGGGLAAQAAFAASAGLRPRAGARVRLLRRVVWGLVCRIASRSVGAHRPRHGGVSAVLCEGRGRSAAAAADGACGAGGSGAADGGAAFRG